MRKPRKQIIIIIKGGGLWPVQAPKIPRTSTIFFSTKKKRKSIFLKCYYI